MYKLESASIILYLSYKKIKDFCQEFKIIIFYLYNIDLLSFDFKDVVILVLLYFFYQEKERVLNCKLCKFITKVFINTFSKLLA